MNLYHGLFPYRAIADQARDASVITGLADGTLDLDATLAGFGYGPIRDYPGREALTSGYAAFDAGQPLDANPYTTHAERGLWSEGWRDAEAQNAPDPDMICPECKGRGSVMIEVNAPLGSWDVEITCEICGGNG